MLSDHDMIKQLLGNPTSIMMIASIYQAEKLDSYHNSPSADIYSSMVNV